MRIIYFDIDCLRPDHLGCYGYDRPTSPTIDWIAGEGTRCNHFYCSNSPCLPSRTSWLSGRFGVRNGVTSNHGAGVDFRIRMNKYVGPHPDNEVFPRQLRRYGYDTVSFSNFADRHNALWFMCGWTSYNTPNLKGGLETAAEVTEPALEWLKNNAGKDNYFMHINYWDVHRCYKMDESWAERFADHPVSQNWPDEEAIAKHQSINGLFTAREQFKHNKSPFPLMPGTVSNRKDFEKMVTGYDAAIAYVDHHIRIILDELERQNVLDECVLVISGDHGDAFGEHGIYSDHVCADECIHKIPMIVRWPGVTPENSCSDSFLYNVDFAPTVCELLNIPAPEQWDGRSFARNLRGEPGLDRDYLVWDCGLYAVQRAVRSKTHLMVETYDDYGYPFDPLALYDMENDPYQINNIAGQNEEVVRHHQALLDIWKDQILRKDGFINDPLEKILEEREKPRKINFNWKKSTENLCQCCS